MHRNVKLKINDGFFGHFQLGDQDTLVAPIINISADKALIVLHKKNLNAMQVGDHVDFLQIVGTTRIRFKDHISAKIHWIKDVNHSHYLVAGCKFCELTHTVRDQVIHFVDSERSLRGQYN